MNTAGRALVALLAPVLVAGAAVATTATAGSAAPGSPDPTPASVCGGLQGDFADYGGGSWDCYFPGISAQAAASLSAVCDGVTAVHSLPANGVVTTSSTAFYCTSTLVG